MLSAISNFSAKAHGQAVLEWYCAGFPRVEHPAYPEAGR
jgi:hypothetical protein